jgi:hypothetical protein
VENQTDQALPAPSTSLFVSVFIDHCLKKIMRYLENWEIRKSARGKTEIELQNFTQNIVVSHKEIWLDELIR